MTVHHLTYEVDRMKLAAELDFWGLLGFGPAAFGPRRRTRKQPVIHWLIGGDHGCAVELLPVADPQVQGLGHVAFAVPQRRWEIATETAAKFEHPCEVQEQFTDFGRHAFLHSPTGHVVELFTYKKALKAGPPLEEE